MSSGRSKLKQRDTITHLLEWPKSRRLTTPDAGEDVKQLEISHTVGRHAKWYGHFGRSFGSFLQN